MKRELSCYMSHHIRGPEGDKATAETRMANKAKAKKVARTLRQNFPIEVYCPGDNDEWAEIGYSEGIITVDQILDIDCKIIDARDCMIMYHQYDKMGGGMVRELDHCIKTGKPYMIIDTNIIMYSTVVKIEEFLKGVADGKKNQEDDLGHRDKS